MTDALERLIDRTLSAQPLLRAPPTLQLRVRAAIEASAQPWWRRSFMHWPSLAKLAFILTSGSMAALALQTSRWITSVGANVIGSIPMPWLYAGVFAAVCAYALLFGLGAAAYRTLYK